MSIRPVGTSPGRAKRADPVSGLGLREPKAKQTQETAGRDHLAESEVVRPAGLEPAAYGFEGRRSIQLSYGRVAAMISPGLRRAAHRITMGA